MRRFLMKSHACIGLVHAGWIGYRGSLEYRWAGLKRSRNIRGWFSW